MTLKYESEILFDLMKRDGDDTPSDVLPYESELKEKYLQQVEGAYPKLMDYRAEWLNYNLTAHLPADFPVETLSNVTSATVDNVVPYAYKSATLKGSTKYRDIDTGDILDTFDETKNLELVSVKVPVLTTTTKNLFNIKSPYQTTSNGMITNNAITVDGGNGNNYNYIAKYKIPLAIGDIGKQYAISSTRTGNGKVEIRQFDENDTELTVKMMNEYTTITILENACYITLTFSARLSSGLTTWTNIQVEKSPSATSYEPHKSNILTVNEDVELRGVGDVQDTLDLMTGELTERIGEVVLDGSEGWILSTTKDNTQVFNLAANNSKLKNIARNGILMCDKLKVASGADDEIISFTSSLYISLLKSKVSTVDELKVYLSQNPITFIHKLATESVKTVDLTITNQDNETLNKLKPIEGTMHLSTSGENIRPLFSGEIPVEATTQNLASFIDLETEE